MEASISEDFGFYNEIFDTLSNVIINETDYKIEVIYTQKEYSNIDSSFFVFSLLDENTYCLAKNGDIVFQNDKIKLHISENKAFLTKNSCECISENLAEFAFCVNMEAYKQMASETFPTKFNPIKTSTYKRKYGDVTIINSYPKCGDTGHNSLTINMKDKKLSFRSLQNMILIKKDTNFPEKPILYLLDYGCCENYLKIYKIS